MEPLTFFHVDKTQFSRIVIDPLDGGFMIHLERCNKISPREDDFKISVERLAIPTAENLEQFLREQLGTQWAYEQNVGKQLEELKYAQEEIQKAKAIIFKVYEIMGTSLATKSITRKNSFERKTRKKCESLISHLRFVLQHIKDVRGEK